jgi:hypothetical protein
LHFPVDTAAGAVLGMTLGAYLVGRMTSLNAYNAWWFDGSKFDGNADFKWTDYFHTANNGAGQPTGQIPVQTNGGAAVAVQITNANPFLLGDPSLVLNWIWNRAAGEWT